MAATLARGNATVTTYGYDAASRLSAMTHELNGTAYDLTLGFAYNPAGQIVTHTRRNDAYWWSGGSVGAVESPVDELNRLTQVGGVAVAHDARGNLTSEGSKTYGYTSENRLATAPGSTLLYDPLGRLFGISASATDLRYDGSDVIEETEAYTGAIRRRYVPGPRTDEPIVAYDGGGARRWFHADERGSIVAVSDPSGNPIHIGRYDEYGQTPDGVSDRFGYTGQMWLPEIGVYSYKARMYDPGGGRFLQSDPIGYAGGMNLYNGMGGDPVNLTDPSGMWCTGSFLDVSCGSTGAQSSYPNGFSLNNGTGDTGHPSGGDTGEPLGGLGGFSWDLAGRTPATPAEVIRWIQNRGGYTFVNLDGGWQWVHASLTTSAISPTHFAQPTWWVELFEAGLSDNLENALYGVMTGTLANRSPMSAQDAGLPGGRQTTYYRYDVPNLPHVLPGVLNNPRIFYDPKVSTTVFFAPYHGKPGPGVPSGYIEIDLIEMLRR